ncbi:Hypothetical protein, putative [Bodo saltans]|uniref:Uncharacterized protein n=1 Tax=Bodo saltans TaxID=75058 RepID=A0A0S4ISN7_BODSA|nr:Hypothetical protein, putative [Bodo saltans]|eukprot:CUF66513.1 Hypothetical protein, putative [Bodo saltans]
MATRRVPQRQAPFARRGRRETRAWPSPPLRALATWSSAELAAPMSGMMQGKLDQEQRGGSCTSSSNMISCLHLGCTRQHPVVDFGEAKKMSMLPSHLHQQAKKSSTWPAAAPLDPIVAAALQRINTRLPSTTAGQTSEHRGCNSNDWLIFGADASLPPRSYPGVAITADLHFPWYARTSIRRALAAQSSSSVGAPLFDMLVSDTLSPELELSTSVSRLPPLEVTKHYNREERSVSLVNPSSPSSIFAAASNALAVKGPARGSTSSHVTDPVLASLAVGLPLLSHGSLAVVRLSRRDQRTKSENTGAAVRTLRQRFANVDFFRDDAGMIALCYGSSIHAGHVLNTPHNLREDFPGFTRATETRRRPKSWDHYSNPLSTENTFFMALHPAFDKAPPPDVLAEKLKREKEAEDRRDQRDGVFMDAVSQTLDSFEENLER